MKIIIAKHSGFCFGVKRAIDIAKQTLELNDTTVYIVGEIVHNKLVVNELKNLGLKLVDSMTDIPQNSSVILKAHGSPPATYAQAKERNLKIIDATCPMVTDIHNKAQKLESDGYQVVVFGDKKHEEVVSICGYINNPIVIRHPEDVSELNFKARVAMICQSTQKIDEISSTLAELAKHVEELLFVNTTCQTTRLRQKEVNQLAKTSQTIIVVGSKNSANTKHLFQEAKNINPQTFWIETADDLLSISINPEDTVAIVSGASTPVATINKIAKKLQS